MVWKAVTQAVGREPAAQCAHLGYVDDPFERGPHATNEHRCFAHMGKDRIDLAHQKRFCLTSAHATCPFLLVNAREQQRDWSTEARGWWRKVSPAYQALTATQLGRVVELGAAAALRGYRLMQWAVLTVSALVLQTWEHVRPRHTAPVVKATAVTGGLEAYDEEMVEAAPLVVEATAVTVAPEAYDHEILEAEPQVVEATAATVAREAYHHEILEAEPRVVEAVIAEEVVPPTVYTEPSPQRETAREWFWRAKNADTLDELVQCLERASALDPTNEMIATNLEWAKERLEAQRQAAKAKQPRETVTAQPALYSARRKNPLKQMASAVLNLVRVVAALGVIGAGVVVVVGALPVQLKNSLQTPIELPDTSGLVELVHVPLGGGYDLGMALPYALGFLALFIGMGLLQREPSLAGRH